MYRPSAEWNNSKTYYEIGADYEFVKNLKISAAIQGLPFARSLDLL